MSKPASYLNFSPTSFDTSISNAFNNYLNNSGGVLSNNSPYTPNSFKTNTSNAFDSFLNSNGGILSSNSPTPGFMESIGNGKYMDAFTNLFKGSMTPDTKTGITPAGSAMGIANAGMNTIMGGFGIANMLSQQNLAKKAFAANLASYNQNGANQVKSYNTQMDNNLRAKYAREGKGYTPDMINNENKANYLDFNKVG